MVIGRWIRAGLEDSPKKNTILLLDGVRAFACLIVIWFHVYRIPLDLGIWNPPLLAHPLLNSFLYFGKLGMLLSLCFVYAQHPSISSKVRTSLQKLSPWLWGTGLLCLLAMILWSYNQRYVNTWSLFNAPIFYNYHYLVGELCISLSFCLCLLALLFGSARFRSPFEWSPLRWVGIISYSLYMWHLPFIFVFILGASGGDSVLFLVLQMGRKAWHEVR